MDIIKMKENHKVLTEYKYELGEIDKGYTNRTLYVNISERKICRGKGFWLVVSVECNKS